MKKYLSARGKKHVKEMTPLVHAHFGIVNDLYHYQTNPTGYINMGTAETHLVNKDVIELLNIVQGRLKLEPKNLHYDYFRGSIELRTGIAKHWQTILYGENAKRQINAEDIAVGTGCSVALDNLAHMLFDEGDVVLVPAPFYSGFFDDFTERAGVELAGVYCGVDLDKTIFETALQEQQAKGKNVRGVLFSSPNNPIGTVYSKEALGNLISFCMDNSLEIVSDEIYAQTIHDTETKWHSILTVIPDEYLLHTHITSSFAKDFTVSGFKTGFVISFNPDVINGIESLNYFSPVSTHTQALLTELLKAPELPALLQKSRDELHIAHKVILEGLKEIGVPALPAKGGIFIFADFSSFLKNNDFDSEEDLRKTIFDELKINISPGRVFKAEKPGWFRVCFAHEKEVVEEACRRLKKLVKKS